MNRDLFLAILSMDSYNRGYGFGIKDLGGLQTYIGKAKLVQESDVEEHSEGVNASFYAIAYDMTGVAGFVSGERVMS
jgi:hypothetical protein